jgi:hypothetical protein
MKKYTNIDEMVKALGLKPFEQFEQEMKGVIQSREPYSGHDYFCATGRTTKGLLNLILEMQEKQGSYQKILMVAFSADYANDLKKQLHQMLYLLNLEELLANIKIIPTSYYMFERDALGFGFQGLKFFDHYYKSKPRF